MLRQGWGGGHSVQRVFLRLHGSSAVLKTFGLFLFAFCNVQKLLPYNVIMENCNRFGVFCGFSKYCSEFTLYDSLELFELCEGSAQIHVEYLPTRLSNSMNQANALDPPNSGSMIRLLSSSPVKSRLD